MWRTQSVHQQSETEFLDQAIKRLLLDKELTTRAEAILSGASKEEPLIMESLRTPQDTRYHAEGPFLFDHLRLILVVLYAIEEEKLHLIDLEEFRRLKGYEGEVEELEEMLKEKIALFEVFALCHDVAKWAAIVFEAPKNSKGRDLGFDMNPVYHLEHDLAERSKLRQKYLDLYDEFVDLHSDLSRQEIQQQFYKIYEIEIHYPHHGQMIHIPVYSSLLLRFTDAYRLSERDTRLVEDLISQHLNFNVDFKKSESGKIAKYYHLAQKRGYDGDDFVDLIQGCLFLDMVCGSMQLTSLGLRHSTDLIINALRSEHEYAPDQRERRSLLVQEMKNKKRNRIFKEVGLDGTALMELLRMHPGPEFGKTLKRVQKAILGDGDMPVFSQEISSEISRRIGEFYKKMFVAGE